MQKRLSRLIRTMAQMGVLKKSWCNRKRGADRNIGINNKKLCQLMTIGILKKNRMLLDTSRCPQEEANRPSCSTNLLLRSHMGCVLPLPYLDPKALLKEVVILPIMTVGWTKYNRITKLPCYLNQKSTLNLLSLEREWFQSRRRPMT